MAARRAPRRLTDEQLQEMIPLLDESDSVELKLTVSVDQQRQTVSALSMDPLDAQVRQAFFFDTPDLALDKAGVVVRARRSQGRDDDTVVKLRPVVPHELSAKLRARPEFGIEVDAMPGGFVCSGSLKGIAKADVRSVVLGEGEGISSVFTKAQRKLYEKHAPEGIELDDLEILGPLFVLKLKFVPKDFKRKMVAEMWLYPDGSRILELSTKCAPTEAFDTAAKARAFLEKRGVDLDAPQETKTRKALNYFSRQLVAA